MENATQILITMLSKREDAFKASGSSELGQKVGRQWTSEAHLEKQKQFLEHMLSKRRAITSDDFDQLRQKHRLTQQTKPILGKRTYTELTADMSIAELQGHLKERNEQCRSRMVKMRQICAQIEQAVKGMRGLTDGIAQAREETQVEFAAWQKEEEKEEEQEDEADFVVVGEDEDC